MTSLTLPFADRITPRAMATMTAHAETVATERGQALVGSDTLLLAIWKEPRGLAALALTAQGVDHAKTLAALGPPPPPGGAFEGGYTRAAWDALNLCWRSAVGLGHNYVGTEHLLMALFSLDADDTAVAALNELGVRLEGIKAFVQKQING